jgi:hypothetical protein
MSGHGREMCPHCSKTYAASSLDHHIATECPYMTVPCPFSDAGCAEAVTRAGLAHHLTANMEHHLLLVHGNGVALRAENEKLKAQLRERDTSMLARLEKLEVQIPRPPASEPKGHRKSSAPSNTPASTSPHQTRQAPEAVTGAAGSSSVSSHPDGAGAAVVVNA